MGWAAPAAPASLSAASLRGQGGILKPIKKKLDAAVGLCADTGGH
jgi:hypothetical protein